MQNRGVYLIHFDQPISASHTCQHYLGSATDIAARLDEHLSGHGSRLCAVANDRGIGYKIVRVWPYADMRLLEKSLKDRKNSPKLCPICSGKVT